MYFFSRWLLFGLLLCGCFWWVGSSDCGCFVHLLLFALVCWGGFGCYCLVLIIWFVVVKTGCFGLGWLVWWWFGVGFVGADLVCLLWVDWFI